MRISLPTSTPGASSLASSSVIWLTGIFDLVVVGDHRLVDVGRDLAGLLVQLPAHVFLGLVELARGQGDGLLDRADDDAGVDALFLAQELDTLIQSAGHTLLALSCCLRRQACAPRRLSCVRGTRARNVGTADRCARTISVPSSLVPVLSNLRNQLRLLDVARAQSRPC